MSKPASKNGLARQEEIRARAIILHKFGCRIFNVAIKIKEILVENLKGQISCLLKGNLLKKQLRGAIERF